MDLAFPTAYPMKHFAIAEKDGKKQFPLCAGDVFGSGA